MISPARRSVVAVREAQLEDLSTVVELRLALLRENATHPIYGRLRRDAERRATELFAAQLQSADEAVLLAERDGKSVGILRCVESLGSPLLQPARYCYISSVYVRPAERRRGVLQALMEHAVAWCVERGLDEMRLHNVPASDEASSAWTALGFEIVEHVRMRRLRAPSEVRAAKRAIPNERR